MEGLHWQLVSAAKLEEEPELPEVVAKSPSSSWRVGDVWDLSSNRHCKQKSDPEQLALLRLLNPRKWLEQFFMATAKHPWGPSVWDVFVMFFSVSFQVYIPLHVRFKPKRLRYRFTSLQDKMLNLIWQVKKMPTLGDHRFWSISLFTNRIFKLPFLTHSHMYSMPGLCVKMADLYPAPRRRGGGDNIDHQGVTVNGVESLWALLAFKMHPQSNIKRVWFTATKSS